MKLYRYPSCGAQLILAEEIVVCALKLELGFQDFKNWPQSVFHCFPVLGIIYICFQYSCYIIYRPFTQVNEL